MKSISRRLPRFLLRSLAGSGVIALACAIGPGAHAQTLGPLVQVAAGDPFGGCTADQVHAQTAGFHSGGGRVGVNILDAPVARGHFLGDYTGLAASGLKTVYPLFGIATAPNVTAEYTRQISLP